MFLVRKTYFSANQLRCFSAQAKRATSTDFDNEAINESWKAAKSYESIPGPTTYELIRSFLPGGQYSGVPMTDVHKSMRKQYGPIYKLKGIFGKRDIVAIFDPKDFEVVYRTEGAFPNRRAFDSLTYYRNICRKDKFPVSCGLVTEQGKRWWDLRHKVNSVMLKPQVTRGYTSAVNEVSTDFVKKLHSLRDANLETPPNFLLNIKLWALESIAHVTMNTRLGLLGEKPDEDAVKLMGALKEFLDVMFELDYRPSFWKLYKTPKFNRFVEVLDLSHALIEKYVEKGLANLKEKAVTGEGSDKEKGVLEKLYEIDKDVAILMALDSLQAGVDTTSSGTFMVLYSLAKNPDKQDILRKELLRILPEKDSPLTVDNMRNMPYLRACIKEGLRVMPVTVGNLRTTGKDIVLKGYKIPKDTEMLMNSQLIHSDDFYFPDAKSFLPERWLRSQEKHENYNPFTYLPFGFGSRNCAGRRFAELEIESLVSRLVRNYYLEWNHPPPEILMTTINIPTGDLKMTLRDFP